MLRTTQSEKMQERRKSERGIVMSRNIRLLCRFSSTISWMALLLSLSANPDLHDSNRSNFLLVSALLPSRTRTTTSATLAPHSTRYDPSARTNLQREQHHDFTRSLYEDISTIKKIRTVLLLSTSSSSDIQSSKSSTSTTATTKTKTSNKRSNTKKKRKKTKFNNKNNKDKKGMSTKNQLDAATSGTKSSSDSSTNSTTMTSTDDSDASSSLDSFTAHEKFEAKMNEMVQKDKSGTNLTREYHRDAFRESVNFVVLGVICRQYFDWGFVRLLLGAIVVAFNS